MLLRVWIEMIASRLKRGLAFANSVDMKPMLSWWQFNVVFILMKIFALMREQRMRPERHQQVWQNTLKKFVPQNRTGLKFIYSHCEFLLTEQRVAAPAFVCHSNHPPVNPARRKPATRYGHCRISDHRNPERWFSIIITIGP